MSGVTIARRALRSSHAEIVRPAPPAANTEESARPQRLPKGKRDEYAHEDADADGNLDPSRHRSGPVLAKFPWAQNRPAFSGPAGVTLSARFCQTEMPKSIVCNPARLPLRPRAALPSSPRGGARVGSASSALTYGEIGADNGLGLLLLRTRDREPLNAARCAGSISPEHNLTCNVCTTHDRCWRLRSSWSTRATLVAQ